MEEIILEAESRQELGRGKVNFNLKVFEPRGSSLYKLSEEDIAEISFPTARIKGELLKNNVKFYSEFNIRKPNNFCISVGYLIAKELRLW